MKAIAIGALAVTACTFGGGHKAITGDPASGPHVPSGEVWLSPQQVAKANIQTQTIGEEDVDDTILTSGRVAFDDLNVAHIYSPVTGKVTKIDAQLGERVNKGQPLAAIESPDVGNMVADLHKAAADLTAAEHALEREKNLATKNANTVRELEQAQDNFRKAKAEMDRAQQKAALLRTGAYDRATQTYTLASPIDGEVITRNLNPGIEVQGQYGGNTVVELFTVGELDSVWVLADVYEMDLARVKQGSPCIVTTVAYREKKFEGKVDWVSGMLDPATRTAKVRCTFDNKERMLKPEMYATARISVDQKKALAIPRNAILKLGDQTVVFVQTKEEDGHVTYERVPVDVDVGESSNWLVVRHGLTPGERIVTANAMTLAASL
jgi:cobalt-zinc-cadmium efflux system membrane fusion protein